MNGELRPIEVELDLRNHPETTRQTVVERLGDEAHCCLCHEPADVTEGALSVWLTIRDKDGATDHPLTLPVHPECASLKGWKRI